MNMIEEAVFLKEKEKGSKIFISHSSEDRMYAEAFVELLEALGLGPNHVFCSSVPGYGIPVGEDIYDYLREELKNQEIYVIFLLSEHYYGSAACLNEMGAAWVLQSDYLSILLPGFSFRQIKGAVNPSRIAIELKADCGYRLNELKEKLETRFALAPVGINIRERHRDRFILKIVSCI